ncbi:MAG: hypothetical protein IJC98_06210 [Clostridia bacterium]|nr:hypothetical protein [Clostridia bacterium]
MQAKRTIAYLLSILTVASKMIACCADADADNGKQTETTNNVQDESTQTEEVTTDTKELTALEKRQQISDGLSEADFNERVFRIATGDKNGTDLSLEFDIEAETGDPAQDAIWKRNRMIENRFNCIIESSNIGNFNECVQMFDTMQNFCEIFTFGADQMCHLVQRGYLYDWYDIPVINLDAVWYNQYAIDSLTVNDTLYTLASDFNIGTLTRTYAMFFNTRLLQNYSYDQKDIYQMVEDGTWTIDQMITITRDVYEDINMNNNRDEDDLFGFMATEGKWNANDAWLTSFGHEYVIHNDDGTLTPNFLTDLSVSALNKLRDFYSKEGVFVREWAHGTDEYFVNGNVMSIVEQLDICFHALRDMEDVYAVVPMPKWDEEQEKYLTNADMLYYTLTTVPKSVSEDSFEFIGTIVEALAAESYKSVFPAFFDYALKGRYAKEPEVARMMDYIEQGRTFDIVQVYDETVFSGLSVLFSQLLTNTKDQITSRWTMLQRQLDVKLPAFYEQFQD